MVPMVSTPHSITGQEFTVVPISSTLEFVFVRVVVRVVVLVVLLLVVEVVAMASTAAALSASA